MQHSAATATTTTTASGVRNQKPLAFISFGGVMPGTVNNSSDCDGDCDVRGDCDVVQLKVLAICAVLGSAPPTAQLLLRVIRKFDFA